MPEELAGATGSIHLEADIAQLKKDLAEAEKLLNSSGKTGEAAAKKIAGAYEKLASAAESSAKSQLVANEALLQSEKRLTTEISKAADLEIATERRKGKMKERLTVREKGTQDVARIGARAEKDIGVQREKTYTKITEAEQRRQTDIRRANLKTQLFDHQLARRAERDIDKQAARDAEQDAARVAQVLRRARLAPAGTQASIKSAISGFGPQTFRQMLVAGGATQSEALERQLRRVVGPQGAGFLTGVPGFQRTAELGGRDVAAEAAEKNQKSIDRQVAAADTFRAREEHKQEEFTKRQIATSEKYYSKYLSDLQKFEEKQVALADKARVQIEGEDQKMLDSILKRAGNLSGEAQKKIAAAISGPGAASARQGIFAETGSLGKGFLSQILGAGVKGPTANYLVSGGSKPPTGIGGILKRLLGGGGGGVAGSLISGLAGGFGIGVGGYALANAGQAVIEATKTATAYDRQRVAAESLAGGQDQLNRLLATYEKVSGGAISKVDSLAAVTRLLSTGYAKSATDLERFTKGVRGASIALGKDQESVTQDVQLAISNTSKKRLDNIGLGIKEVDDRIESLRKNNKAWNRETAFGEAVLSLLDEKYGKLSESIEGQATGLEKLTKAWDDLTLAMGKNASSPVNKTAGFLAGVLNSITEGSNAEEERRRSYTNRLLTKAADLESRGGGNILDKIGFMFGSSSSLPRGGYNVQQRAQLAIDNGTFRFGNRGDSATPRTVGPPPDRFKENQYDVVSRGFDDYNKMVAQFDRQRTEEEHNYEQQVASSERSFHKAQIREEQDFNRQRARGQRDYEKQIVSIMRDAQDRDAEYKKDLDKTISRNTRDSNKRLKEINDNYNEQQEKAERDHRENMLKAVGALDAIAVLEERKKWRDENKDRKKQHEKDVKDEKESLDEKNQDAKDANQERLDDAHKADKKRLDDMAADRKQQLADEDEDRGIQKDRAIEDHNDELTEMARVHDDKMKEINREAGEQERAFNDALETDLASVGIYLKGYQEKLAARDKLMEEWFDKYTAKIEGITKADHLAEISEKKSVSAPRSTAQYTLPQYASGGPVRFTGPAMLHAGEYVMPSSMVASAGGMNNNYNSHSRSVVIQQGAISIVTTPGYEHMVGEIVEQKMIELLDMV